ncbi:MAG TPA: LysR family transcriptional regulator [Abditibacteriaceae bacterium]|jgi:DNA-binding transcriptional LysR family regulator
MALNFNHLAIFVAVAETGNLTRAAERLHISQPAVSKQLRELEKSLGMALFHRLSKGVRLTEGGEVLLSYARQIFALEVEAAQALNELRNLERGQLTIGASTTIGVYLLPEICAIFRARFPGIELNLEIANTQQIQNLLLKNELDLGLTEGFVLSPDIQAEVLGTDEIIVIAAPGHALFQEKNLKLTCLLREPILWREIGSGTRAVVENALRDKGFSSPPHGTLGSTEAIKRAVTAGDGIAFVSKLTVKEDLKNGTLRQLGIEDFQVTRPLQRLRLSGKYEGRAVREFLRLLRPFVRERCAK